jgi:LacI family transcriptional regulator, fructose operon transcriptional repressor
MATIKEVAHAAGVSTATVSRVLTNGPHVRPEVRARVLAAVEALAYRPNLVARSLRSQQSSIIGLIVSDIRNPFFTAISRAVEDAAYHAGYTVFLCNTDEDPEKEAMYLQLMRDANVAGVIFSPTRQTSLILASMGIDFPIVVVDRAVPHSSNAQLDSVLLDNVDAAYQLTSHLIEQGYGCIAGIFGMMSTTGRERKRGYDQALADHGIPLRPELVRFVPAKADAGLQAASDLLKLSPRPDAVLASNSLLAEGALRAIREANLAIPDDIALAGFDETSWAALVEPPLTLIAQPTDDIGATATELLLKRLADPSRSARQVILKGRLITRGSTVRDNASGSSKLQSSVGA